MTTKKNVLGLVHPSREIRRAPLVGMQFLHQGAMGTPDLLGARPRRNAKDLIGLLVRHFAPARSAPPRTRVTLRVFTPAGLPAVQIRCE